MKMYHSTTQAGREGILRDGLKTGQSVTSFRKNDDGGYTKAGEWADEYYGTRPVYLAMQQGLYSQLARQLGLEFEVEVDPNTLVADLPSLVDTGAYIESGGMYWEYDDVPSAMKPVADGDGWIAFEELLQPGSIAAKAAIDTTGTAASLNDIPQERVVQLTSESILREYIRGLLTEKTIAIGQCYPHAVKLSQQSSDEEWDDLNKFKVVHGRTTNKWNGESYLHAWVEKGDMIFDWQTHQTKPDGIPRDVYYDMYQPEVHSEYTASETVQGCKKSGHAGPWKTDRTNEAVAKVSNEYGWSAGDKKGFMLDDEGMEKSDKDNIERYLKALGIMK